MSAHRRGRPARPWSGPWPTCRRGPRRCAVGADPEPAGHARCEGGARGCCPFSVGRLPWHGPPMPCDCRGAAGAPEGDGLSERTVRPISRRITPIVVRLGLAPNTITVISLLAGARLVAAKRLTGTRWGYPATAVLMLVSVLVVCGRLGREVDTATTRRGLARRRRRPGEGVRSLVRRSPGRSASRRSGCWCWPA